MKVLTYNIWEGGGDRLTAIASVIAAQSPDVVALQEANDLANAAWLAERLDMHLTFGEANNPYHVAWLSRAGVVDAQNHRLPNLSKTLLEIRVPFGGAPLRLFATHFGSRHDVFQPAEEARAVLALIASSEAPHLLAGDFNALHPNDKAGPPPPFERLRSVEDTAGAQRGALAALLEAGYVDCYRAAHPRGGGYTYRTSHPWLRLDYVLASPSLAAKLDAADVVRGRRAMSASDHFPVWAAFKTGDG